MVLGIDVKNTKEGKRSQIILRNRGKAVVKDRGGKGEHGRGVWDINKLSFQHSLYQTVFSL